MGNHVVKFWSSTQKTVALSGDEPEFIALVKGRSIGLGIGSQLSDLKIRVNSRLIIVMILLLLSVYLADGFG